MMGDRPARRYLPYALIAAAIATVYWPVPAFDFVSYDDGVYVFGNPHVRSGPTWDGLVWAFSTFHRSNWHPLTWLSLMIDAGVGGVRPQVYHFTNVVLHLANSMLLFLVLVWMTRKEWRSALVALLFAVHPLHVESVAWISERKDTLSTLLGLLAILAWLRWIERPAPGKRALVLVLFGFGLMAKPMLVMLPVVLLILNWWPLGRIRGNSEGSAAREGSAPEEVPPGEFAAAKAPAKKLAPDGPWKQAPPGGTLVPEDLAQGGPQRESLSQDRPTQGKPRWTGPSRRGPARGRYGWESLLWEKAPLILLAAASCVITLVAQRAGGAIAPLDSYSLGSRVANAIVSYVRYIGRMFWPADLAVFYPLPREGWPVWVVAGCAVLLAGITALVLLERRQRPYLLTGWLWYLVTLLPVIGLVQVGDQAMADRYTYIPLTGLFIMVVWGCADLLARGGQTRIATSMIGLQTLGALVAGAVVIAFAACAHVQVWHWRDSVALYEHALAVTKDNAVAHNNLGLALLDRDRPREATAHFREALRIDPRYSEIRSNLALALIRDRRYDDAVAESSTALDRWPDDDLAHARLGLALALSGKRDAAEIHLREALRLNADNIEARINLGSLLADTGRSEEARVHAAEALRIDPWSVDARRLMNRLQHPAPVRR